MAAGGGHLQGALRRLLAAHVGEVEAGAVGRRLEVGGHRRRERRGAGQVLDGRRERGDADDRNATERRRLGGVGGRQQHLRRPAAEPEIGDRQRPSHRPHGAVEAQLAGEQPAGDRLLRELAVGDQERQRDRQVEVVALLAQVGGGEVDHHRPRRQLEAAVLDRRPHPLAALADRGVGEADDLHLGQPEADVDLDLDRPGVDPPRGGGGGAGEHRPEERKGGRRT